MPNYTVVSRTTHADKRWKPFSDYAFASGEATVPLLLAEFAKAALGLPIAFTRQGNGYFPVAVLGLAPGKNYFVTPEGRWIGNYVPAALRSYPFRLADANDGSKVLCVDEDSGLVASGGDGEAFFTEDSNPAPGITRLLDFITQLDQNQAKTHSACTALNALNLIVPWEITLQTDSGNQEIQGLFKIDESVLNVLSDEDFVSLRKPGALSMAYCQMISMQHLPVLGQIAQARAKADAAKEAFMQPLSGELDLEFLNKGGTISFGNLG